MKSDDVAFEIANNEKFAGIGLTLEDLEEIMKEAEKLFALQKDDDAGESK